MKRKQFLASLMPGSLLFSSLNNVDLLPVSVLPAKVPPYLKQNDLIGITCPAGFISAEEIKPSVELMESWGFRVDIGRTVGERDFTFGGTDAQRAADMQYMLDHPKVKAIMCARGGYGAVRIIDQLDFSRFIQNPKWIIGFSDITVLHSHVNRNFNIATLHSKMCNSFPDDWSQAEPVQISTIVSIKEALTGQRMQYSALASPDNRFGIASGELVGGNLSILESLSGSRSEIETAGKILFLEDTGEYLYNIDRMFYNLKRSGKLDQLSGLIIGGFKVKPDDPGEEFGRTIEQIVLEKVKGSNFPVCFNFPVGHQKNNFALKCGVKHRLTVDANGGSLVEN